jgi:hypothetical protein
MALSGMAIMFTLANTGITNRHVTAQGEQPEEGDTERNHEVQLVSRLGLPGR